MKIDATRLLMIYIYQIMSVYSAIRQGWNVRKIGKGVYEFTHQDLDVSEMCVEDFVGRFVGDEKVVLT